jgi:hypothetical protein
MEIRSTKMHVIDFDTTVRAVLRDSAERWLSIKDRSRPENAIIICLEPPNAFVLSYQDYQREGKSRWICDEVILGGTELADFFAAFGSSYTMWRESNLGGKYPVRAFIRDGQDNWNFSVDMSAQ